jgi:hypothetical protein
VLFRSNARELGAILVTGAWLDFFSLEAWKVEQIPNSRSLGHVCTTDPVTELDLDMIVARLCDDDGDLTRFLLGSLQDSYPGQPHWMVKRDEDYDYVHE